MLGYLVSDKANWKRTAVQAWLMLVLAMSVISFEVHARDINWCRVSFGEPLRIMYGVQGTGGGHLTRARQLVTKLRSKNVQLRFVFSGRPKDGFDDADHEELFGKDAIYLRGVTWVTNGQVAKEQGKELLPGGKVKRFFGLIEADEARVNRYETVKSAALSLPDLIRDVNALDLTNFDLVISDFEPITAWAARISGVPLYGIAHQYSFFHDEVPQGIAMRTYVGWGMKAMAPVKKSNAIGLHFDPFKSMVLPPMVRPNPEGMKKDYTKITVYLPHENQTKVIKMLAQIKGYRFEVYAPEHRFETLSKDGRTPLDENGNRLEHIHLNFRSDGTYVQNFYTSFATIVNAGFGAMSEALKAGIHLMAKPQGGQPEQRANVIALKKLGYGEGLSGLNAKDLAAWLEAIKGKEAVKISYPDVGTLLADWVEAGLPEMTEEHVENIWQDVQVEWVP